MADNPSLGQSLEPTQGTRDMMDMMNMMGKRADWEKFLAEARRSTNVEDNRQGQIYQEPWWRALFGEITHK
jgi:hypothetical protein